MTHTPSKRRYRKTSGRRVWVFSELNHQLTPEQLAKVIAIAGLERARREAKAEAEARAALPPGDLVAADEQEADHA